MRPDTGPALGQLSLSIILCDPGPANAACIVPCPADGAEECPVSGPSPVECPVGCRGTTGCLCGQGELSDHPLWIEND